MFLTTLAKVISKNKWFYIPYAVLLVSAVAIQFTSTQFEISLFVNSFHNSVVDFAFNYLTDLGDGWFAVAIVIAIFLFRKKHIIEVILCFSLTAVTTQLLKRFVFSDHLRPSAKMKTFTELHYVPGVNMHEFHSFPSGHTTSAFAIFLFLSLIASNKKLGLIFLIAAVFIGLSRIYLLQHFFEDVLAGSIIGVTGTTIIYSIFEHKREKQ